jgi:hypothetical protein
MVTISLPRLHVQLDRVGLRSHDPAFRRLLEALNERDVITQAADRIEAVMEGTVGLPSLVVVTPTGPRVVRETSTLQGLIANGLLGVDEGDRLERRLLRRHRQWLDQSSAIGLRGLRRRERQAAGRCARLVRRYLRSPAADFTTLALKLALLAARAEGRSPLCEQLLRDVMRLGRVSDSDPLAEPRSAHDR